MNWGEFALFYYTLAALFVKSLALVSFVQHERFTIKNLLLQYWYLPSPGFYFAFILLVSSPALLLQGSGQLYFLLGINFFFSLIFMVDLWYFKAFGDLATVQLVARTIKYRNMRKRIFLQLSWTHLVFTLDIPLFLLKNHDQNSTIPPSIPVFFIIALLSMVFILVKHHQADVVKRTSYTLLKGVWVPFATIINASPIAYHYRDIYFYFAFCRHSPLKSEQRKEIEDWFDAKQELLPDNQYKAMFKGKNLIFIQVESLENFVIKQRAGDSEICPRMNQLLRHSLYFSNIREQVNGGYSSDADLMANSSLYPVRQLMTFFRYPYNHYPSLPKLLGKMGYQSSVFYPNRLSCWNVGQAYPSLGFSQIYGQDFFDLDERISNNWLSDGSYFRQVYPVIKQQIRPFYTFLLTQSSHGPWDLPKEHRGLNLDINLDQTKLGGYFQSIHYTDKQIGIFLDRLEQDGLLEDTVVVIYGDHCGIHKYNQEDIDSIENKEDWWYGNGMRVPLIIYHKQLQGKEIAINGGQIDIMPTVAYLMGVEEKELAATAMGRNLLKTERDFVILKNGQFIGKKQNEAFKKSAVKGLEISEAIISSDYFRVKEASAN